ncbi:MAG: IclR family transcriptional regulator [Anaerolineaceae bacterium]|nr:IclR family transcriptional regulator [Anaerolineaceae bacterium]
MENKIILSVDKSMRLIEILLNTRRPLSLKELSESSGYPKSTIHALLFTMMEHDMIRQHPDGRYGLGIRLYECGCAVSESWDISARVHPFLEKLAQQTGAGAFITFFNGKNVISFHRCVGSGGLQVIPEVGMRMSLHATAQGKLFLSTLSRSKALAMLREEGMTAFTPHTITDTESMMAELDAIRVRGYAIEHGEYRRGLMGAAAPVREQNRPLQYALGIVGLFRSVTSEDFQSAIKMMLAITEELSYN